MTALAWVAGAALVLLAALGLAMTMRATTDTAARDAAKRDREELARRESLRVVLDEHTRIAARNLRRDGIDCRDPKCLCHADWSGGVS